MKVKKYLINIKGHLKTDWKRSIIGELGQAMIDNPEFTPSHLAEYLDTDLTSILRWFRVGTNRPGQSNTQEDEQTKLIRELILKLKDVDISGFTRNEVRDAIIFNNR